MAYLDIKLDTDGDLAIEDGDVAWLDGADAVAQHIRCRLRMFKGEWFLNEDEGVPWFDEIFEKGVEDGRVVAILRKVILGTPGVTSLTSLSLTHDRAERELSVVFEAVTDLGVNIVSADYAPFLVAL
jgi:hypothetical protein